jgi:benzoyl-CoA reductase subunit B
MIDQGQATEIPKSAEARIVGRGARDGARLFREWFSNLTEIAASGETAAYVFVMGSMAEILRTFDLPIVFPEINGLQTAIRGTSIEYLEEAEDFGFSPDICGYVKADFAMQMRGGQHPMVTLPKPGIAITTNACNTYIKWAEIWERMYDIPVVVIDVPSSRAAGFKSQPGDETFAYERRYMVGQIKELIAACEKITGKKFDIDKFRQHLAWSNEMSMYWKQVVALNRNAPAVFNALADGTTFLGMANSFRGTEEGVRYFKELVEELTFRTENGIGIYAQVNGEQVQVDQKYRLGFVGVPCYPLFRQFSALFERWGGVFVTSSYLGVASGGTDSGYQFDLDNPIESLAEGTLVMLRDVQDDVFYGSPDIEGPDTVFNLDGIVYHPIKSCRTGSTGLADRRYHMAEDYGLATLFLESDMMDPRVVTEAQMRNRVDAFFEGLETRRQHRAVSA